MSKEKIKKFVMTNQKRLLISLVALLSVFLIIGIIVYATTDDSYVVEVKDDGANNIAQNGNSSITKKIIADTTKSLTYEVKLTNLQESINPEVAILIDTSESMQINDTNVEVKAKAIQFVSELLNEVPGVKISISNNEQVKNAMNTNSLTNYTNIINGITNGEGTNLSNGVDYAVSTFSASNTNKTLVIFSDATDSILDKLENATSNDIVIYSILTDMTNSEYESGSVSVGKVQMISDVQEFSSIYNKINKSLVNVKITDIFTETVSDYFDFEVVSKNDDMEVLEQENGYIINIPTVKASEVRTLTFKLTLKDNVAIDAAKIYRELETSDSMSIEYRNAEIEENQSYEMKVSPTFVICKKYSLTIQAVSEKSDKLPVTNLEVKVVGTVVTGQDEEGNDIVKTIYDEVLTTDSNGKIKIEDLKTLGDITFEIKPNVDQIGYADTSATQIIVHNDPTGVGTIWAESDTTTPDVDVVNRNITVKLPILAQTFNLRVETVDSNNSNVKLGDIEYRLIQPKLNSKYDMEALYGTTDADGNLVFKPAVMTKNGTYEYILTQMNELDGYDPMGNVSLYVTFDNGNVTKFTHKYNENVSSEYINVAETKVVVGNIAQKDDTFKLEINVTDEDDQNKKIEGAVYDVELTRVASSGEQITSSHKGNITNSEGKIELELPGNGNVRLRITEVKPKAGYAEDSATKEIIFVRKEGTVQYISAKNPIAIDAVADSDANAVVVNFKSKMKTTQNRIQVHLIDNLERDINIPNAGLTLTKIGDNTTYNAITDVDGIANFIINDEEAGTCIYQLKLTAIPYGYTGSSLLLGTISVHFDENKCVDDVSDADTPTVPYFATSYELMPEGDFAYNTGKVEIGLEPDGANLYNLQVKLTDADNLSLPVVGAKYDITITSGDFTRNITGRDTDANGMLTTRLVGENNITITIKETETIKGYTINGQTQIIELTKVGDNYQIANQEPYEYDPANGVNIGAQISGKTVIYHDTNKQKTGDDTLLNLYINKIDTNNNLVGGVKTVLTSSTLKTSDGEPLNINYIETDQNGYFEILGIKVNASDLNNGERLDYIDMYEVDVNGNKVANTDIKLKLTFRFNENKQIIEITNVEATWGNRLISKREYSGYESSVAYESNVYLDIYTNYDDVGNFELDLNKVDKDGNKLLGSKYDVIVTRLDGTRLIRKDLEVDDSVEFPGFLVAAGTVIEITEKEAPIGYSVNEYTQILKIDSIDAITGDMQVSFNGNRATMASKDAYILEDGTLKTSVKIDLTDYELDTFKFGITAKDDVTSSPVAGYVFRVNSNQGADVTMPGTDGQGKTNSLVGANYKIEDYVVTYEIKTLKTANFYKELQEPIQVKVVFDLNGQVKGAATIAENQGAEGYGTVWNITATNTIGGNDIDIEIKVKPEDPLIVNVVVKDAITDEIIPEMTVMDPDRGNVVVDEFKVEPSLNISGVAPRRIEVGYVLPNGIQTYTLKHILTRGQYADLEDKQFKILYDENGDIEEPETISDGLTITSYSGKEITLEVKLEPKVPITITNVGYFDNANLADSNFEVILDENNKQTVTTNSDGKAQTLIGTLGKAETKRYTVKQTKAKEGYATVEDFQIDVDFDENRTITGVRVVDGNVNKYIEFVTVSNTTPSNSGDYGYNGNDKGIVNILVKNYPEVQLNIENVDRQDDTIKLPGTIYEVTSSINTKDEGVTTDEQGIGIAHMDKSGYSTTVTYTIKELSPSARYQTLAIEAVIEVDFDENGFITDTRVRTRDDVTTASLPTVVNTEDKLKVNVQIKSNPELKININKVDEDDETLPVSNVDFEITARIVKDNLSNYSEEDIGKLTLNTTELTDEAYLSQVLDRLKINPEDVELIKQNIAIENIINDLKNNNNLTEEEEDKIRNGVNNNEKINIIVDLGKLTKTQVNKYIRAVTYANVVDTLISNNTTTQDRVNELLETLKKQVRLDVDNVTTNAQGQAIAYMDKTLANKTIEYTIKETRKADGYDWLDEVVILEITYDSTGKMIQDNPVKVVSGAIEITNIDVNAFSINVTINNKPSDEVRIHLTVEDAYDSNKKLETAEFDAFLVDTTKGVGFLPDDKYRINLASGSVSAHGEDVVSMGVYEGEAGNRILRLVQKATPNTYYLGDNQYESIYQSISYALLANVSFNDEGSITGVSLYNPGGDTQQIGYIADGRYIQVSHTRNTINITVRYYPMLQVQMQTVDMYTGENLAGTYKISTALWGSTGTGYHVKSGYINPHAYVDGTTYESSYITDAALSKIEDARRVGIAPTEADNNSINVDDPRERIFYIYETAEPNSPIQYQKYRARHITNSVQYLIGKILVKYDELGQVIDAKVIGEISNNNIKSGYIETLVADVNNYTIQLTVKYTPITTITATVVDEISGVGLSGIRINPYVNKETSTTNTSYEYRTTLYYTTGSAGSVGWTYWGASVAGGINRYELDSYTSGSGYDGYFDPGNIILDVTYDENGRVASVTPRSTDSYGDINAIDITWENNNIKVKIPYSRRFNTKIDKIDYYDSNIVLNAMYKVISSEGANVNVAANTTTTIGKIYAGKTVKYTLSEVTAPTGYVPVTNLEYYVTFNNDGTVRSSTSTSDYFKFVNSASADTNINRVKKTDMEIAIKNKPRFDIAIDLSDKFYPELKLEGATFSIENSKGDIAMGAVPTDANGIMETYVGPVYPDEEITYTVKQTNTVNGYKTNDTIVRFNVKFNENGKIETYSLLNGSEVATMNPSKYVNTRGVKIAVTNVPNDVKLGIYKYDELSNEVMSDVKFNVKTEVIGEGTSNNTLITNSDGTVVGIVDNFEERTDYRVVNYTISEIEVPNSYRKIQDVVIQVTYNPDGSMYLYDVLSNESGVTVEVATNKQIKYINTTPVHIKLTIPNDNAYDLIIKNEDINYPDLGIEGTKYDVSINGIGEEVVTNEEGIAKILNQTQNGNITIRVAERAPGEGYRANNNNDTTIEVYKGEDIYSLALNSNSNPTYADVEVDEEHGTITVTFKNETKLELNVVKENAKTSAVMKDIEFEIIEEEIDNYGNAVAGTQNTITTDTNNITDEQGLLYFDLGLAKQNKIMQYTITEKETPDGYFELDPIKVKVTFDMYGRISNIEDDSYYANCYLATSTGKSHNMIFNISNEPIPEGIEILPDGLISPEYAVKVISADSQTGTRINGSIFQVEVFDETEATFKSVTGTTRDVTKEIAGASYVFEKGVMKVSGLTVENNAKIAINQIETAIGYIYGSNQVSGNVIVNANYTTITGNPVRTLELTLVDNGGFDVSIDNVNREIIIKVKNDPQLTFDITKIDADTNEKVKDAKFTVTSVIQTSATVIDTDLNETARVTDENGHTTLNGGLIYAGKTVIYTISEEKLDGYNKLDDIVVLVRYDTKGNILYYEILSDVDYSKIEDGEIQTQKRILGESDVPGIVEVDYTNLTIPTGKGTRILELEVKNKKEIEEKDYQIIIEKHHESDPDYPYFIPGVTFEISVTQEYGKQLTTWTDITDADGIITSPFFSGYGNITIQIKELASVDGYKPDFTTKTIRVTRDKNTNELKLIGLEGKNIGYSFSEDDTKIYLKPVNEIASNIHNIVINKVDKSNNVLIADNPASFEMYRVEQNETIKEVEDETTGTITYETQVTEIKQLLISQDTDSNGRVVANLIAMPEQEGTYKYILKETKAPTGYLPLEGEVEIDVTFATNTEGDMVITNAEVVSGKNVKIAKTSDQLMSIIVENQKPEDVVQDGEYSLDITKTDVDGNAITTDTAVFKLTDEQTSEITYLETNEYGKLDIPKFEMPNTAVTYKYTLNEIKAPEGYVLNREDITIELQFEQDDEGKTYLKTVTVDGENIVYKNPAQESELPDTTISIDVINEEGQNGTGNTNSKPYTVILNKVDSQTKERITERVEFDVSLVNGEIIHAATNEQGQIIIENVYMPAKPEEYEIVVKELTTPEGYLEDTEMKIVKAAFEGNGDNMVISNIQLDDTYNKNIEIVTEECTEDKIVLNVLNEKANPELYVISKEDGNGNDIYEVQRQIYEGRHYTIDRPFIDTKVAKYGSNMTVQEFIDNLESNGVMTILDKDGKELAPTDRVKTGMTLRATLGTQELTFTIIVKGDVDGDGRVRTKDLDKLLKHLAVEEKITDPIMLRALDMESDGKIRTTDLNSFYNVMEGN